MAVNLSNLKRAIDKEYREEDKALAKLQRYFEKRSTNKPSKSIKFTTELNVGGYKAPIGTSDVSVNSVGSIISDTYKPNASLRHSHDIAWEDIERAYRIREAIHSMVADEYEKADKGYRGRRLFQQGEFKKSLDAAGRTIIRGQGSQVTVGGDIGYGYGHHMKNTKDGLIKVGNYGKLDVDIQKRVLDRIYSAIWKETDTHLLEKFHKIELKGSDFNSVIKGTDELLYDIKKVKEWTETVRDLVTTATLEYQARIKEFGEQSRIAQQKRDILTIGQLEQIGRAILGLAIEYCPIETGFLRSSGKLYVGQRDIRIIFECPYAVYVHDNPNAQHPVGRYHFLVDAAQEILPKTMLWTEQTGTYNEFTGNDSFVLGSYMKETWDKDSAGNIISDMYWQEHKGYQAVYIDIDTNLRINYAHRN